MLQHRENASITASYHFRPTVFATVLAVLATGVFTSLAVWQYGRAIYKENVFRQATEHSTLPAIDLNQTQLKEPDQQFRPAKATGTWEIENTLLLDNIVHRGKAGYHVITPLRLHNGQHILVNRGWIAVGNDRTLLPTISTPSETVQLTGTLDLPRSKPVFLFGNMAANAEGNQRWLYLDITTLEQQLGYALPPYLLLQTSGTADGLRRDWTSPENKAGMHIGYSIQWAAFALIALASYLYLNIHKKETP